MTMESNYHQELVEPIEANNHKGYDLELNLDSSGVGRLYECVFCKRGFNTAQALGGHMNIHRKDRVRNKPSTIITSNKKQDIYHHIPSSSSRNFNHEHDHDHDHDHDDHKPHLMSTYATYFPPSNSSATPMYEQEALNLLVPRDRCVSLSLGFAPRDLSMNRRAVNQKEELDLELRLGYDS